jgi:hypothetical protein
MRISEVMTPQALALIVSGWCRTDIENAIEQLISALDAADSHREDLEPEPECETADGLIGDSDDAEDDVPIVPLRITRRTSASSRPTQANRVRQHRTRRRSSRQAISAA